MWVTKPGPVATDRSAGDRAQSEVIGVVLLTGVVVLLSLVVGFYVLSGSGTQGQPVAEVEGSLSDAGIEATHAGGDSFPIDELVVVVRDGGTTTRYAIDPGNVTGDGDGRFEPSETFARAHALAGDTGTLVVAHEPSGTVLFDRELDVERASGPTAAFSFSPSDPEPGETITFDAGGSDADGPVAEYRWAFGDGSTTTTTDPTVDHTYAGSGEYDVTLTVADGAGRTDATTTTADVDRFRAPENPPDVVNGLDYAYYRGDYSSMPDFGATTPTRNGTVDRFTLSVPRGEDDFALRYTGFVAVPEEGTYTFETRSDDGSFLYIGDQQVVGNGGTHPNRTRSGTIDLEPGRHAITVTYFEAGGDQGLSANWAGPGVSTGEIPASALYRRAGPSATFTVDCEGPTCSFDAGNATAPGSSIAEYRWDFGDGSTTTTAGPTVDHTYGTDGTRDVTLTVVDAEGRTDDTVRPADPAAPLPARSPGDVRNGAVYEYYEAAGQYGSLEAVDWSSPLRTGTVDTVGLSGIGNREDDFAVRYRSFLDVPSTATYTFYTGSDDGSQLYVDGQRVVENGGTHGERERSGQVTLEAGYHNVTVRYFERGGGQTVSASYEGGGVSKRELSAGELYRETQRGEWRGAADWDGAVEAASVVHAAVGDHPADGVELGHPATDRNGSNLLTHYPFDGDAADATGNGHDGAITGARVADVGLFGTRSLAFDGDEDLVEDADAEAYLNGRSALSVSAWIRSNRTNTDRGVLMGQSPDGTDSTVGLRYDQDGFAGEPGCTDCIKAGISVGGDNVNYESASDTQTTGWQHIVVTWTGGDRIRIYRNGSLDAGTYTETGSGTVSGVETLLIGQGAKDQGSNDGWDGYVDGLRIYDRGLSPADVSRLYNAGRDGSSPTPASSPSPSTAAGWNSRASTRSSPPAPG